MFNLYLKFLSYSIHNLIDHLATSEDEIIFQDVFQIYLLFHRLAGYLVAFSRGLGRWQRSRCHGGAWAECQGTLRLANHVMPLLDSDLWRVIGPLDPETMILRCKLRGGPSVTKFDVFDVWVRLIEQNALEDFSGWLSDHSGQEVSRTVYLPNYSLLLPAVQRTSELSDPGQSQWRHQIHFHLLHALDESLNRRALTFLPELPPELPIDTKEYTRLKKPVYARAIVVPQQEEELIEIVNGIQKDATEFRLTVNKLRDTLLAQVTNEPKQLFKIL